MCKHALVNPPSGENVIFSGIYLFIFISFCFSTINSSHTCETGDTKTVITVKCSEASSTILTGVGEAFVSADIAMAARPALSACAQITSDLIGSTHTTQNRQCI